MGVLDPEHGLVTAFSREGVSAEGVGLAGNLVLGRGGNSGSVAGDVNGLSSSSMKKVYVTHRIRECGAWLWPLLSQRSAVVYVSGSAAKMPVEVFGALQDVVREHGGLDAEAAADYVRQLELRGRYHVEAWS
jgi:sulfite reductase alpha subunit-like flavoprotein